MKFQVYAKQKGLPYWPAKVIRIIPDGSYDVRFFGGYHQRALVEKQNIRPISVNIQTLQVKRTSLWNKASDELKKHQEFVTKVKAALPEFQKDPYGDPFIGRVRHQPLDGAPKLLIDLSGTVFVNFSPFLVYFCPL